jgi:hypothetical protein
MTIPPLQDVGATHRRFGPISPPFSPHGLKCLESTILSRRMGCGKTQMVVFLSLGPRTASRRSSRSLRLPPILAPAANTGILFNHGIHEAEATAATAVATTATRVAAMRTATRTAAMQRRRRDDGNATVATRRRRRTGSDATAAGIDTDNNQLVPHGSDHRMHNLAQSTFSGNYNYKLILDKVFN